MVAVASVASPALAQDVGEARALFERGLAAARERRWDDALTAFRSSLAIVERELSTKGLVMSPGAGKTVRLRVTRPVLSHATWTVTAKVALEAELGNGANLTVVGESLQAATRCERSTPRFCTP